VRLFLKSASIPGIGTFGRWYHDGKPLTCSVEREWKNNEPSISCIPAGDYRLQWHDSPKYGRRLHFVAPSLGVTVSGPSQRTHCLIHPANWPNQVQGCNAPGLTFRDKVPDRGLGVASSRVAVELLEALVPDDGCDVTVERYVI